MPPVNGQGAFSFEIVETTCTFRKPMKRQLHLKLVLAGILCFLLFNFPFLGIYDRSSRFFGVPALYAGMFVFWLLFILLLYRINREHKPKKGK